MGITGVTNKYLDLARRRVLDSLTIKQVLADDSQLLSRTVEVAEIVGNAFRAGHRVFLFGNGGSAADAQHIAAEFVGKYLKRRRPLPALALTVNTSSLTAIGNDYAFDEVFSRQVDALGVPDDIAIGISTSGNSKNVVQALKVARERGMKTVAFTGRHGGRMRESVDCCLSVPSDDTPRVQECHILLGHIICEIVEHDLIDE